MKERSSDVANSRLVHLMTIARHHDDTEMDVAVVQELLHGNVILLVPTQERNGNDPGESVMFTHAPVLDGVLTLFAFTGESAVRTFTDDEICCMSLPSGDLLRACMQQGFGAIVLDAETPNETCVTLTPFDSGEN